MARDSYPAQFREDLPDYGIGADRLALIETYYAAAGPIIEELDQIGALKGAIVEVQDYFFRTHRPMTGFLACGRFSRCGRTDNWDTVLNSFDIEGVANGPRSANAR